MCCQLEIVLLILLILSLQSQRCLHHLVNEFIHDLKWIFFYSLTSFLQFFLAAHINVTRL